MSAVPAHTALAGGGLLLWHGAFGSDSARLFDALMQEAHWEQHHVLLFGRRIAAPRLSAWHADAGCSYRYSGTTHAARSFTPALLEIRARTETLCGQAFNSVLLNLYRDGQDGMSWHSDDEPELGSAPVIASVSLGATRRFLLRSRAEPRERFGLDLEDGSLLLMQAPTQANWQHAVPKTRRPRGPRINLTWRLIGPRA